MKILRIISSMDPQGGGPSEGIRQVAAALEQMGHQTECLTADDPNSRWLADQPLPIHAMGPGKTRYAYCPRLGEWLSANAHSFDAIVVCGLWQHHGLTAHRTLRKLGLQYFVMPHGMLDPWFKRTYPLKHIKKWLYWPWADYRLLRDAEAVLFTCEEERLLARQSFWLYKAREVVVSFGTSPPPSDAERLREIFLEAHQTLRGKRLLLFLSRIHEKKGCDLLLEAFAQVAAQEPTLHLVMAGPDQTGWKAELQARAQASGVADRICWPGMLEGDMKWGAFYAGEAFVLPSHQENFGIAVAEALGCGLPVLISNKVNIWREIQAHGAGLVMADTLAGTEQGLRTWLGLASSERQSMASSARRLFDQRFTADAMAINLLGLLAKHTTVRTA